MKPFDLEAAKRGEPIVAQAGFRRIFVGVDSAGYVVAEDEIGHLHRHSPENIFMAPKKRTVWVNLYFDGEAFYHYTKEEADDLDSGASASRLSGKAYPVEIEE